jgi:hypothetical protein
MGIFESVDFEVPLDTIFLPNPESVAVAKELATRSPNGRLIPYNANLMII